MTNEIYFHNPQCSKSRAGLEELRALGHEPAIREYLADAPTVDELRHITRMLGVRPIEICRRAEPRFVALGLSEDSSDEDVLRAMSENPILIERPIFIRGNRAVVGRPPERVRELL